MNISLLRYGFGLILLSLLGGFVIPSMAVPRLGLSAHTIGALSGILLVAVGAIWQQFQLAGTQATWLKWTWLYSSYANWLACMFGGVFGAGKMTPLASSGMVGSAMIEMASSALFISVALTSLAAVGLSLWGLRRAA